MVAVWAAKAPNAATVSARDSWAGHCIISALSDMTIRKARRNMTRSSAPAGCLSGRSTASSCPVVVKVPRCSGTMYSHGRKSNSTLSQLPIQPRWAGIRCCCLAAKPPKSSASLCRPCVCSHGTICRFSDTWGTALGDGASPRTSLQLGNRQHHTCADIPDILASAALHQVSGASPSGKCVSPGAANANRFHSHAPQLLWKHPQNLRVMVFSNARVWKNGLGAPR